MPPSESDILKNYLLLPAPLPTILTIDQFKQHFPPRYHDASLLRSLYRDLQAQRSSILHVVKASIEEEVKRGRAMRAQVVKASKGLSLGVGGDGEEEEEDGEVEMERALFGSNSGAKRVKHSLDSILPSLGTAVGDLEKEIAQLQAEEDALRNFLRQTVGGLSDLRYGKLENGKLGEDVVDGLIALKETCEAKS